MTTKAMFQPNYFFLKYLEKRMPIVAPTKPLPMCVEITEYMFSCPIPASKKMILQPRVNNMANVLILIYEKWKKEICH